MKVVEAVLAWPFVAHGVRAAQRFLGRFGIQFAAAITYFSVLSMVPILMVAFAALGLTATILRPNLADLVRAWLVANLDVDAGGVLGDQVATIIDQAFHSWQAVGLVGLVGAAWAGAKWVMHLQVGVRVQLRPAFEVQPDEADLDVGQGAVGFLRQMARELGILFGLFLLVLLTMLASSMATSLRSFVGRLLAVAGVPVPEVGSALASLVVTAGGGFALFWFLFTVMPEERVPVRVRAQGAAIGSLGLVALEYAATFLLGSFAVSAAVAVFGSVIVLMLFLNLFASLVLVVAAWIATHPGHVAAHAPVPTDATPA